MKRLARTFVFSLAFLCVTALVGWQARFYMHNFWSAFGTGCVVLAAGAALGFCKVKGVRIAAFFVNAISMGFFLRSWYIDRGFDNSLPLVLGVAGMAAAYMIVFALPLLLPAVQRGYAIYFVVFVLLSLGGYVALLCFTETTWVSTLGYFGLLQISFIAGSSFSCNDWDDEVTALWVSSYSIVVCAAIILLAALGGDCDGCDGCSCDVPSDLSSPVQRSSKRSK